MSGLLPNGPTDAIQSSLQTFLNNTQTFFTHVWSLCQANMHLKTKSIWTFWFDERLIIVQCFRNRHLRLENTDLRSTKLIGYNFDAWDWNFVYIPGHWNQSKFRHFGSKSKSKQNCLPAPNCKSSSALLSVSLLDQQTHNVCTKQFSHSSALKTGPRYFNHSHFQLICDMHTNFHNNQNFMISLI